MRIDLQANEFVLKAADSKHYHNKRKVTGKLILTNRKIYFATNGSKTKIKLAIDPAEINEVMPFKNRAVFANGLCLITKTGTKYKFEVKKRNDWAGMIARVM
jgi:hypothetical protein